MTSCNECVFGYLASSGARSRPQTKSALTPLLPLSPLLNYNSTLEIEQIGFSALDIVYFTLLVDWLRATA